MTTLWLSPCRLCRCIVEVEMINVSALSQTFCLIVFSRESDTNVCSSVCLSVVQSVSHQIPLTYFMYQVSDIWSLRSLREIRFTLNIPKYWFVNPNEMLQNLGKIDVNFCYQNILKIFAWQNETKYWVNHIKTFVFKTEKLLRFVSILDW